MRIIAIRPEPGLAATIGAGRTLGLEIEGVPLFRIEPVAWSPPPRNSFDAILLGSANAVRLGGPHLYELTDKPAYAVGEKTAAAAREAGFEVAATGAGGLQAVLDSIAEKPLRLLRLAGETHVPLELPRGVEMETRIVYRSTALAMSRSLAGRLASEAIVLLHSGEAARHFSLECERLGVDKSKVGIAALAPRIAEMVGPGWGDVALPDTVGEAALLAMVRDICH